MSTDVSRLKIDPEYIKMLEYLKDAKNVCIFKGPVTRVEDDRFFVRAKTKDPRYFHSGEEIFNIVRIYSDNINILKPRPGDKVIVYCELVMEKRNKGTGGLYCAIRTLPFKHALIKVPDRDAPYVDEVFRVEI